MKFFTQDAIKEFKRKYKKGTLKLKLAKGYTIEFKFNLVDMVNQYEYIIYNKQGEIIKFFKGKSYLKILEDEVLPYLKKNNLLLKDKTISIISEISETEINTTETLFEFKEELETGKEINEKELNKFLQEESQGLNLSEIIVKGNQLKIIKEYGLNIQGVYKKKTIISTLIAYIDSLIKLKKEKNIKINKEIKIVYQSGKVQNLNIVETGDNGNIELDNGYLDKNLVNDVFTLCSIEELAIDKTKLKIWLKKILLREKEKYLYF